MIKTVDTKGYMGRPIQITGDEKAGLIIHKPGKTWVLTHVPTGMVIGPGLAALADMLKRRAALLAVLADWSQDDTVEGLTARSGLSDQEFKDKILAAAY